MNDQSTKEIKNQAIYWRKKLNWYLNDATPDEYNEEEVQELMDLLDVLDPESRKEDYYTAENSLNRFKQTLDIRLRIHDEFDKLLRGEASLADYPDDEVPEDAAITKTTSLSNSHKKHFAFKAIGFRRVAMAASLVATLLIGGTVGAYAQKEGVFNKLVNNEDKALLSTNPSSSIVFDEYRLIEDINKLPMKYLNYVWTPISIPENLTLHSVELLENDFSINIECKYFNSETKQFINTSKRTFRNGVTFTDQIYDGFEFYMSKKYDSIKVQYLVKENEDYTEYIALFENKNSVYSLISNCSFDVIESLIKENIADKIF